MSRDHPYAYHITWGTYGKRLHGDIRDTVDRDHNEYGIPFVQPNDSRRRKEIGRMCFEPRVLNADQRSHVESIVPQYCVRGDWDYHVVACQPDHVHVVLTSPSDGKAIRRWLKRWIGDELALRWLNADKQPWWAEGGSVKWLWRREHFDVARQYVLDQRLTPFT